MNRNANDTVLSLDNPNYDSAAAPATGGSGDGGAGADFARYAQVSRQDKTAGPALSVSNPAYDEGGMMINDAAVTELSVDKT